MGSSPSPGAEQALSPDADPAQVGFTPDGSALIVTERGTDSISAIPGATPTERSGRAQTVASSGPTPYGFALTSGGTLVVTEAFGAQKGAAAASSYSVAGTDGHAGDEVGRQRSQRDLLGGRDRRRPLRLHDQLRRRRRVPVLDRRRREPHPRRRHRGHLRRRPARAPRRGPHRRRAATSTPSTPTPARIFGWAVGEDGALSPVGSWGGLPDHRRRPRRPVGAPACASSRSTAARSRPPRAGAWSSTAREGIEGQGFLLVEGRAEGRLSGRLRAANYPRRRTDGTLTPDFRGVIETDDGAVILFAWHGYGRATEGGPRHLLGSITHLSDDDRYRWLNDTLCVLTGEVRPQDGGRFDVVLEVSELVWEPLSERDR